MSNYDNERDEADIEHIDTAGCCECGSTHHVCQECPTFNGPAEPVEAATTYCQGFCPPNSQPIDPDEAAAGATVCDECSDEMDSRARDAFDRRYR